MATPLPQRRGALTWLAPIAFGLAPLLLRQALCTALQVPAYLVPKPTDIAHALATDGPSLLRALGVTPKITVLAFCLAVVLGVALAFLFVQNRLIEASLFPYAILLQVTPVVAIAPLVIIWVKQPTAALVICATLVTLFPIVSKRSSVCAATTRACSIFSSSTRRAAGRRWCACASMSLSPPSESACSRWCYRAAASGR